jgi:hypothetical protein
MTVRARHQLPMKPNGSSGMPCNGAASGDGRGRPCVLSRIAQAAETRAASLLPLVAMSASASITIRTCPSSNPESAARMAAESAFCDPAGRLAPALAPPRDISIPYESLSIRLRAPQICPHIANFIRWQGLRQNSDNGTMRLLYRPSWPFVCQSPAASRRFSQHRQQRIT